MFLNLGFDMEKPILLISRCLLGENVRYDGCAKTPLPHLGALRERYTLIPVCPEVEFGMPVPRPPMILQACAEGVRLIRRSDGADLSAAFAHFCRERLRIAPPAGAVLKSKSPSCGVASTKCYDTAGNLLNESGAGFFAAAFRERFPNAPIANEHNFSDIFLKK